MKNAERIQFATMTGYVDPLKYVEAKILLASAHGNYNTEIDVHHLKIDPAILEKIIESFGYLVVTDTCQDSGKTLFTVIW